MRFVNRKDVAIPEILSSDIVKNFNKDVKEYLESDDFKKVDITRPTHKILPLLHKDLANLFKNKCAYCESFSSATIDHFRPMRSAESFEGRVGSKYYTWLALDWGNLYAVCHECNVRKSNLFPVKTKGTLGANITTLREQEKALLLDPCWDKPEKHLSVSVDGQFIPVSEKGNYSIKVYDLNRMPLVKSRKQLIDRFQYFWIELQSSSDKDILLYKLESLLSPKEEYSGTIVLILNQILNFFPYSKVGFHDVQNADLSLLIDHLKKLSKYNFSDAMQAQSWTIFEPDQTLYSPYNIRNVQITNFKGINTFSLDFPNMSDARASCTALIGANTVGKTSILQAIALGILGHEKAREIYPDARKCLSKINESGSIEIAFWNVDEKNVIQFNKNSKSFSGETPVSALLMGYGAYRLAAKKELSQIKRQDNYRLLTLFNERELINGPIGLESRHHEYEEDIARTIDNILKNENVTVDFNRRDGLSIIHNGEPHKLENFSSGYQSIISFVTDIMDVLYTRTNRMEGAKGIVIVDELDAHLHPEWKLKIVSALRDTFPYVQFIFSTHDPLILRGVEPEEVTILRRNEAGEIEVSDSVPDVMKGLGIDQMLTSLFGLNTTMNAELENMFSEYYSLLSREENLSHSDESRISDLKQNLSRFKVLGRTKRERLMYTLIDRELSEKEVSRHYDEWSEDSVNEVASKILREMKASYD